jgi:hypothetical protein
MGPTGRKPNYLEWNVNRTRNPRSSPLHESPPPPAADHPTPPPAPAEFGGSPVRRPPNSDRDNRRPIAGRLAEQRRNSNEEIVVKQFDEETVMKQFGSLRRWLQASARLSRCPTKAPAPPSCRSRRPEMGTLSLSMSSPSGCGRRISMTPFACSSHPSITWLMSSLSPPSPMLALPSPRTHHRNRDEAFAEFIF